MFGRSWHPFALFGGVILAIGALVSNETTSSLLIDAVSPAEPDEEPAGDAAGGSVQAEELVEDEAELDFATWAMEGDVGQHAVPAQPAIVPAARSEPASRAAPPRNSARQVSNNQRYDPSKAKKNLARDLTRALRKSGNP